MVEGPLGGGGLARAGDTCSCHMCDIVTARDESGRRWVGAGWAPVGGAYSDGVPSQHRRRACVTTLKNATVDKCLGVGEYSMYTQEEGMGGWVGRYRVIGRTYVYMYM